MFILYLRVVTCTYKKYPLYIYIYTHSEHAGMSFPNSSLHGAPGPNKMGPGPKTCTNQFGLNHISVNLISYLSNIYQCLFWVSRLCNALTSHLLTHWWHILLINLLAHLLTLKIWSSMEGTNWGYTPQMCKQNTTNTQNTHIPKRPTKTRNSYAHNTQILKYTWFHIKCPMFFATIKPYFWGCPFARSPIRRRAPAACRLHTYGWRN